MAANEYSAVTAQLVTELSAISGYSSVVVSRRIFRPSGLPAFPRYCIIVSPAPRPWDEQRLGAGKIGNIFRIDLYLLVRRWEESDHPLFGTSAGNLGLFQMIEDVKVMLRLSTLGGLLDKTYDEPGGDSAALGAGGIEFQEIASPGFENDEFQFVHVAKVPYKARTVPFCHPRN